MRVFLINIFIFYTVFAPLEAFASCKKNGKILRGKSIRSKISTDIQGITQDGENWYISNRLGIYKIPVSLRFNNKNLSNNSLESFFRVSIPRSLRNLGYDHFGGISLSGSEIVVALEGATPLKLLFFNKNNFELKSIINVPLSLSSLSWVAAKNERFVYFSQNFLGPKSHLYSYDRLSKSFKEIQVTSEKPLYRIQGGTYHYKKNQLILASDNGRKNGGIFSLSLDEYVIRKVSKVSYFPKFPFYHEVEGLTYWPDANQVNGDFEGNLFVLLLNNNLIQDSFKLLEYCL